MVLSSGGFNLRRFNAEEQGSLSHSLHWRSYSISGADRLTPRRRTTSMDVRVTGALLDEYLRALGVQ